MPAGLPVPPGVLLVGTALVVGWMALWPARRELGGRAYHLFALPVGLLGWAVVPLVTDPLGIGFTPLAALGAILMFAASVHVPLRLIVERNPPDSSVQAEPSLWSWLAWAAVLMGVAWAVAVWGISVFSADSWMSYEALGSWLYRTGHLTAPLMAERMTLLPSIAAANRLFGGEWTYVVFPVFAANTLALLWTALDETAFPSLRPAVRYGAAAAVTLLLATTAPFLFHSIYMHSHMLSALFIMTGLAAIVLAFQKPGAEEPPHIPALVVAGLASAGLALARPDGIAYAFTVLGFFSVTYLASSRGRRPLAAFALPPAILVGATLAMSIWQLGLWAEPGKLSWIWVTAMLMWGAVIVAALWTIDGAEDDGSVSRWVRRPRNTVIFALSATSLALLASALVVTPETALAAGANMIANLFGSSGWNTLWWYGLGTVLLALLFPTVRRARPWTNMVIYALAQFLGIAIVIHVLLHTGRVAWGDSFNRAVFAIVPVVFWYVGLFAGGALSCRDEDARAAGAVAQRTMMGTPTSRKS